MIFEKTSKKAEQGAIYPALFYFFTYKNLLVLSNSKKHLHIKKEQIKQPTIVKKG